MTPPKKGTDIKLRYHPKDSRQNSKIRSLNNPGFTYYQEFPNDYSNYINIALVSLIEF